MKPFVNKSLFVVSLILLGTLFFSSCSKDKNDTETALVPRLATISEFDNKGVLYYSEAYQYDKQNRLIKVTFNNGYVFTFEYSGSTVIEKGYAVQGFEGSSVLQLNNQGLCISMSGGASYNTKYEYYDDNYKKSTVDESPLSVKTYNFKVSQENIETSYYEEKSKTVNSAFVKDVAHFNSSFLSSNLEMRFALQNRLKSTAAGYNIKTEYLFYTDKLSTLGNANRGISFYGKQNKNPIKKEFITYTDTLTRTDTYNVYNSTYEFDAKNRITKQLFDDGYSYVYTYIN